ncbi:glycosyltransferase family 4 protein [Candidatus Pseudothioglobus singularis]|jgi:glycosyltransferase involved in cell wall biosynthesis|nr:glycosyltransferase family 4 protein [Candidatus Pseudothioglobus singularis]
MHILLVITNLSPGNGPFQRIIKFDKSIKVSVISLVDNQKELEEVSQQFGSDTSHVDLYGLDAKFKLVALFRLIAFTKKIKPDIVQSVTTLSDFLCIFLKYFLKIPIVSFEATFISRWRPLKKYLILLVRSLFDEVICVSYDVQKKNANLNSFFRRKTKRSTIYNGVNFELIDSIKKKSKYVSNKYTIGYTGDLKPTKNLSVLFYAFRDCYRLNSNLKLLIIGTGPDYNSLKKLAVELHIDNSVEFTGQISRVEVFERLKSIDLFVMPSLMEGLCESVVQAMASRVPVIVSDISQNQELVSHNKTGLLFTSNDSRSLKNEILKIINNEINANQLVNNARIYTEKFLNINNITYQYTKLYEKYLK